MDAQVKADLQKRYFQSPLSSANMIQMIIDVVEAMEDRIHKSWGCNYCGAFNWGEDLKCHCCAAPRAYLSRQEDVSMYPEFRSVRVPLVEIETWQAMLDGRVTVEEKAGTVMHTYSFPFDYGIEIDLKLTTTTFSGAYVDAILFDGGCEALVLEPQYSLYGPRVFTYKGKTYIVEVRPE